MCSVVLIVLNNMVLCDFDFELRGLTLSSLQTKTNTFANSVGPDETSHNEPSHPDLHCLPFSFVYVLTTLSLLMDMSKSKDERVQT